MAQKITSVVGKYMIVDGRGRYDIDRAAFLELCDSLSEARRCVKDYGDACILYIDKDGDETLVG